MAPDEPLLVEEDMIPETSGAPYCSFIALWEASIFLYSFGFIAREQ